MKPTKEQNTAVQSLLQNNPSMCWDGTFGYYSTGQVSIHIYWSFDKTQEMFPITFNIDGTILLK